MQGSEVIVPSPKELDAQSATHIDEWVDVGSPKFQEVVGDKDCFNYFLKVGFRQPNPFFHLDTLGRIWGKPDGSGSWFPYHDRVGGKNYGYRMSRKAAN